METLMHVSVLADRILLNFSIIKLNLKNANCQIMERNPIWTLRMSVDVDEEASNCH